MAVDGIRLLPGGELEKITQEGPVRFDFNGEYRGYYPECRFTAAASCKTGLYIAGLDGDGAAHLFSSLGGEAWAECEMTPKDHPQARKECGAVVSILDSPVDDHMYLVCENGYVFTLPGCPKCVKETLYSERFAAAEIRGENLELVCTDGRRIPVLLAALQQLRTSWSFALPVIGKGAAVLDLRDEEDGPRPLPHAKRVSVQEALLLVRRMPAEEPVFLFCYTGVQADTIAQYARALGHKNAFSLGGEKHLLEKNGGHWPE